MDLRIFVEPQQGASFDTVLAAARTTERSGFDASFRSDHYLRIGTGSGLPGPTDSWVTLGGLARETARSKLGTMVTSATFRHPGPLAVSVAQLDHGATRAYLQVLDIGDLDHIGQLGSHRSSATGSDR